jgi:hypothetical protein
MGMKMAVSVSLVLMVRPFVFEGVSLASPEFARKSPRCIYRMTLEFTKIADGMLAGASQLPKWYI